MLGFLWCLWHLQVLALWGHLLHSTLELATGSDETLTDVRWELFDFLE